MKLAKYFLNKEKDKHTKITMAFIHFVRNEKTNVNGIVNANDM